MALDFIVLALSTEQSERDAKMVKELKAFAHNRMPLLENRYCTNDDYKFIAERLKYKFVKKGHYVVRQGETGSDVYFIVQGCANVITYGPQDIRFLDRKHMFNEMSIRNSKKRTL